MTHNPRLLLATLPLVAGAAGWSPSKDILELVDRFTGRSPSQPPPDPPPAVTNVQQTVGHSYGPIQAQHATITQTFNVTSAPQPPGSPAPPSIGSGQALPLQRLARATYFTGREAEMAQLLADLQPGRVVTLTGPGGIGKSARARPQGKREKREGVERGLGELSGLGRCICSDIPSPRNVL